MSIQFAYLHPTSVWALIRWCCLVPSWWRKKHSCFDSPCSCRGKRWRKQFSFSISFNHLHRDLNHTNCDSKLTEQPIWWIFSAVAFFCLNSMLEESRLRSKTGLDCGAECICPNLQWSDEKKEKCSFLILVALYQIVQYFPPCSVRIFTILKGNKW